MRIRADINPSSALRGLFILAALTTVNTLVAVAILNQPLFASAITGMGTCFLPLWFFHNNSLLSKAMKNSLSPPLRLLLLGAAGAMLTAASLTVFGSSVSLLGYILAGTSLLSYAVGGSGVGVRRLPHQTIGIEFDNHRP